MMTSVQVAFILIFAVVQLCSGQKLTLDDNLSLNRNKCHHPLINQLSAHNIIEVGSDVKRVEVLLSPLPNFLLSNCVP